MTYLLGISAYYHDSAAAIIKDGEIIEQGNHKQLMKNNKFYAKLYTSKSTFDD